jgi:hypothetical protein
MSANFKHIRGDEQILPGSISTDLLANGAVTSQKININADLPFNEYQALTLRLENVSINPAPGNPGRLIWNTALGEVLVDDGSAFESVSNIGTVASLQIDSNVPLTGAIQFLSGTNISLVQVGQVVTVNAPSSLISQEFIIGEDLTSQVQVPPNNVIFVLSNTPIVNKESIYLNGVKLKRGLGNDYTIVGATVTLVSAPQSGDSVTADYIK